MRCTDKTKGREEEIIALYRDTFTASEGAEEGRLIGKLAHDLLQATAKDDLLVFLSLDGADLSGGIVFTRLVYPQDDRSVFLLGPVAVRTDHQRMGIGQRLLTHGLDALRDRGVDVAITYGDPDYYSKVGFERITEDIAQAPCDLSHPHGWLAQSLNAVPLSPLKGPSHCVPAFNDPDYW